MTPSVMERHGKFNEFCFVGIDYCCDCARLVIQFTHQSF